MSSKAPKQTLICLLDCMAHMQEIPAEVENTFLDRTIKAFTRVRKNCSTAPSLNMGGPGTISCALGPLLTVYMVYNSLSVQMQ